MWKFQDFSVTQFVPPLFPATQTWPYQHSLIRTTDADALAFKRVVDGVLLAVDDVGASQVPQENYDGEVMHN